MEQLIRRLVRDEDGATAIEYALIAGLIFLVIVSALNLFAQEANAMFAYIGTTITAAVSGA